MMKSPDTPSPGWFFCLEDGCEWHIDGKCCQEKMNKGNLCYSFLRCIGFYSLTWKSCLRLPRIFHKTPSCATLPHPILSPWGRREEGTERASSVGTAHVLCPPAPGFPLGHGFPPPASLAPFDCFDKLYRHMTDVRHRVILGVHCDDLIHVYTAK